VIGVDAESCISILNRSAERLIGRSEADALGRPLTDMVPEIADMFATARSGVQRLEQIVALLKYTEIDGTPLIAMAEYRDRLLRIVFVISYNTVCVFFII